MTGIRINHLNSRALFVSIQGINSVVAIVKLTIIARFLGAIELGSLGIYLGTSAWIFAVFGPGLQIKLLGLKINQNTVFPYSLIALIFTILSMVILSQKAGFSIYSPILFIPCIQYLTLKNLYNHSISGKINIYILRILVSNTISLIALYFLILYDLKLQIGLYYLLASILNFILTITSRTFQNSFRDWSSIFNNALPIFTTSLPTLITSSVYLLLQLIILNYHGVEKNGAFVIYWTIFVMYAAQILTVISQKEYPQISVLEKGKNIDSVQDIKSRSYLFFKIILYFPLILLLIFESLLDFISDILKISLPNNWWYLGFFYVLMVSLLQLQLYHMYARNEDIKVLIIEIINAVAICLGAYLLSNLNYLPLVMTLTATMLIILASKQIQEFKLIIMDVNKIVLPLLAVILIYIDTTLTIIVLILDLIYTYAKKYIKRSIV